jgi:glutathione S-transferase
VIIESSLINEYLDEAYPAIPLAPVDPVERHRMRLWCKRFDALHAACGVLTYAIGVRPGLLQRPADEIQRLIDAIPDSARREQRRSVVAAGVDSTHFAVAIAAHVALFNDLNDRLQNNDWLAGEAFSLADASLTPYVLRVDHLQIPQLLDANPALARWYERIQLTPQFATAITDHLPAPVIAGFKAAGETVADELARHF